MDKININISLRGPVSYDPDQYFVDFVRLGSVQTVRLPEVVARRLTHTYRDPLKGLQDDLYAALRRYKREVVETFKRRMIEISLTYPGEIVYLYLNPLPFSYQLYVFSQGETSYRDPNLDRLIEEADISLLPYLVLAVRDGEIESETCAGID